MLPYEEGSVFLVPVRDGGFARGVVARVGNHGMVVFGYFFGPVLQSANGATTADLCAANALLCLRFGDLGLINGEWPICGKVPNWDRLMWPMPDFVRRDPLGRLKSVLVRYSDDDPMRVELEHPIDDDNGLAPDSLSGYGAVEIKLRKLL